MQKPNSGFAFYFLGSFSSSVDTVWGFIGESAVLSCSIPESKLQDSRFETRDTNVHWRDNEGKNVFDIIGCNEAVEDQAPEYKNRVATFPEEYTRGNFSIKLIGLQKTDARKYSCIITGPFQNETSMELHVKGVYNLKIFIEIL